MVKKHNRYRYTVDGVVRETDDGIMDGGQIREAFGKVPASDFVLIQIVERSGRSIGLEDEVEFVNGETAVFLSFRSDRVFTFTVDERGWEWGASSILASDIRRYAQIPPDYELVMDSDGDAVVPPEGSIDLGGKGVERLRSRENRTVIIKVNGRSRTVEKRCYTYREIAAMAYPEADFENFNFTTVYLHGVDGAEGDLVEEESIEVRNGMVFNVRRSDRS